MNSSTRIIVNTAVMYGRMLITMVITLLSSRWILLALGEEDFGIYSLVAGILTLLIFLNMTMSTATQRFLSYAQGKNDFEELRETFYFSSILHLIVGVFILVVFEVLGIYLLNTALQVPEGKEELAEFVLHTMSISVFVSVIMVPYQATLISHENIVFVAIVQILEAVLKLLLAIGLLHYSCQRLKAYAIGMMLIQFVLTGSYVIYSRRKYEETKFVIHRIKDYTLMKELSKYAGWNLIGSVSSLLKTQGTTLLLNSFYGVIMNTAYGIATQVKGQLTFFSTSILTASRPQIVKSEGEGNRPRVLALSASTTKFSFLLLSFFAVPLIVELPYVLEIWLKIVPDYTIQFTRIIILTNLVCQFRLGICLPIESTGNIKKLQIVVGGMHFIVIPLGYLMLKFGMEPSSVLLMVMLEEAASSLVSLFIAKEIAGLNVGDYITRVILPLIVAFVLSFTFCSIPSFLMEQSFLRLVFSCLISVLFLPVWSYFFILNSTEKTVILSFIEKVKHFLK